MSFGAEPFASTEQGQLSYESLAEMLEAFLAAHAVSRKPSRASLEWVYLTLPEDKQATRKEPEEVTKDDVRRVVKHTIQMLRNPAQLRRRPRLAVRNLRSIRGSLGPGATASCRAYKISAEVN